MDRTHQILAALEERLSPHGFHIWAVGGTVRDALLGLPVDDFDFVTDAGQGGLATIFPEANTAFLRYGSIRLKVDVGEIARVDLTLLRKESGYVDHRHPAQVSFTRSLAVDSRRRDFTINALYLSKDSVVSDFHEGIRDLSEHVLRFIGDPWVRVQEDPLRICRGERLASRLGLSIEGRTAEAFQRGRGLLDLITPAKLDEERMKGWVG